MWSIFFCSTFWFKLVCTINHPPRPFILEAYLVTGDVWPMERVWNKQFTRYSSWSWNHHHSIHLNGCIALALVVLSLLSLFMIFNFSFFYYFNIYMFDFRRSSVGTFMRQPTETSKSKVPPPKLDYRSMVSVDDMPELFVSFDSKCNFMKYSTLWTLLFMNRSIQNQLKSRLLTKFPIFQVRYLENKSAGLILWKRKYSYFSLPLMILQILKKTISDLGFQQEILSGDFKSFGFKYWKI